MQVAGSRQIGSYVDGGYSLTVDVNVGYAVRSVRNIDVIFHHCEVRWVFKRYTSIKHFSRAGVYGKFVDCSCLGIRDV
jgi:hypothetical protein